MEELPLPTSIELKEAVFNMFTGVEAPHTKSNMDKRREVLQGDWKKGEKGKLRERELSSGLGALHRVAVPHTGVTAFQAPAPAPAPTSAASAPAKNAPPAEA